MRSSSFNSVLSTFNIVLLFAGYEFAAVTGAAMLGIDSSRLISIPYRVFSSVICVLVILLNLVNRFKKPDKRILLFFVFWGLLILRFFYDVFLRVDVSLLSSVISRTWLYMIVLTILPMISVILSITKVNFEIAFKLILIMLAVSVCLSFVRHFDLDELSEYERLQASGLGSIGTGHLGLTVMLFSAYYIFSKPKKNILIIGLLVAVIGISLMVMLRSGSRGPVLSFIGVIIAFFISRTKHKGVYVLLICFAIIFFNVFFEYLLKIIEDIAPNLYYRFESKEEVGQFGSRLYYYSIAFKAFLSSPLWGAQFAIYLPGNEMIYAHNIFIDALMQLGLIGGGLLGYVLFSVIKIVFNFIAEHKLVWICLLFIQLLFELMVSSSIYYTPLFSVIIVLLFTYQNQLTDSQ